MTSWRKILLIDLNQLVLECAPHVAPNTMIAVIKTESKGNPLAIGLNRGKRLAYGARSMSQAIHWVNYLERNNYDFDVGLAQVNIRNIHKYGFHAADMLQPCNNLQIASDILRKNYHAALTGHIGANSALLKAISAYNTGNYNNGFKNGYVRKVINNAVYAK